MTTTTNLGLDIYDTASGSATNFLTYRLAQAGNSSNMTKIDDFAGFTSASIASLKVNSVINVAASYISTNYFEATVSAISSYAVNLTINLKLNQTITGATTININSYGNKLLKKVDLSGNLVDVESGDLVVNRYNIFIYNGTYFILVGNGIFAISGSSIMSDTSGSVIKHNASGIVSGSYTQVIVDRFGHVTAGSQTSLISSGSFASQVIPFCSSGSILNDFDTRFWVDKTPGIPTIYLGVSASTIAELGIDWNFYDSFYNLNLVSNVDDDNYYPISLTGIGTCPEFTSYYISSRSGSTITGVLRGDYLYDQYSYGFYDSPYGYATGAILYFEATENWDGVTGKIGTRFGMRLNKNDGQGAAQITCPPISGSILISGSHNGASGSFTSQDGKTVTVTNGLVISIV